MIRVAPATFDAGALIAALSVGSGAVASFVGIVRDDGGLTALTLEHYPGATEAALARLTREATERWSLTGAAIHHRVGRLAVGDPVVFVGTAAAHRHAALEACAFLIDRLKTDAPLWKHETYGDGRAHWVAARDADGAAAGRWVRRTHATG